jgi:hypothetical protein
VFLEPHVEENLGSCLTHGNASPGRSGCSPLEALTRSKVMELLYERCAGLDVHKKNVKVCLLTPGPDQRLHKEIRTYGTKTQDLLELRDWRD